MNYRYLGRSGLQISELSFGAWVTFGNQMDEDLAHACMEAAFERGVNFFDNAEVYAEGKAETIMGQVFKRAGWKRSDLVVSTKIFWGGDGPNDRGLSRKHLVEGTDAALARLQLDYVDLIYCHRPDLNTPIEETVRAMNFLIDQGKAFYWGTSEWSAEQIREAHEVARRMGLIGPVMEQPGYNLFRREKVEVDYLRLYEAFGLGLTTFSPLAGGLLTGKYLDGIPEGSRFSTEGFDESFRRKLESDEGKSQMEAVRGLVSLAEEIGATPAQLAIAWCLKNPHVSSVITGASRPEQVEQNMGAADVAERLSPEMLERIEGIVQSKPRAPRDLRAGD